MGVDENNMDFIEDKEMNDILDSAISEMLGRIKRSLEEEVSAKPLPPMMPIPIREEEPQKLAKVLEDLGVQTDAVAVDGEKKMQYQINIQEHARPACSPLHINLSLPPHSCPPTTPTSSPAPVKSTAEREKGAKNTEDASVQTVRKGDAGRKSKKQSDVQRQAKPGVPPIHINVTMPHICQSATAKPTPAASQPDTAAEEEKEDKRFKEIGIQTDDMDAEKKKELPPETSSALSQPETAAEEEKKDKRFKEIGVQVDETKEDVPPETTPVAPQPDTTAEQEKQPKLFKETGVQTDDTDADTGKQFPQPLTVQLTLEAGSDAGESMETLEPQEEDKSVETVSVQTEETAADREKPVLYDINIQEHARPENTPLRINFNLPPHTCPKSVDKPTSDEECQAEPSELQSEDEVIEGVAVQTVETGDDRPKPVQYKINIQEHKRPATSPLHITVNQPRHTCPASTVQSSSAISEPAAKKPKIMKDLSVQTGENGGEKSSPNKYQVNIPKQPCPGSSPIRIHVNVPPHDCQSSTIKRQSVSDIPDSSQPPKRPKQVGDMSVQTDEEASKSRITQADKHGHVYINVKVPPHTCNSQTGNSSLDKNVQATRKQSKSSTFNKGEDIQTSVTSIDNSRLMYTKNQQYVLPDGTPFYITLNTPSHTCEQAATEPTSADKISASRKQSKPATFNKDVAMQTGMASNDDSKMAQVKNQHFVLSDGTPLFITLNTLLASQAATQPNSDDKTSASRKQSQASTFNKDVGMQTSVISNDDSKMAQIKNQQYVLPDGTPLFITLNTPAHTCQQAATEPTSADKTSASRKQSKSFNKDVGMQTSVISNDDSKMAQIKNQHVVLPDGTPLFITLNTPSHTCQQTATEPNSTDKTSAGPAQSRRSRLKEDVGVQADETPFNSSIMSQANSQSYVLPDGSPLQFTFNRPPSTHSKTTMQPILGRKIPGCHMVSCPGIRPRRMKCCCHK